MCQTAPVLLLNVFEALQVQAQHAWQRFDLNLLLSVLQPLTGIAEELVVPVQRFCCAAESDTALGSSSSLKSA